MSTIIEFMRSDHRRCDDLFAAAEAAVNSGDWPQARQKTADYLAAMEHHFDVEEKLLFPAFESRTGMQSGPTMVMRNEHQQMRQLLDQLKDALEKNKTDDFLGVGETLLIMTQQHNMKEEGILYPMMDNALGGDGEQLLEQARTLP